MNLIEAVALAKEKKNDGVAYLYEHTYQKNYYVALKFVKDEELAKDLLQDAYIKAFDNIGQLEKPELFESWMSQIVARTALNELRKKNPILFTETENEDGSNIADTFEDDRVEVQPEVVIDKNETARLVREMMADLSEEQRVCITMFYMEDLSVKDIAATIGVSENTVKSRLNYGRQKIKEKVLALEKQGTKLYGIAPIPFFVWLLSTDAKACAVQAPAIGTAAVAGTAGTTAAGVSAAGAGATAAGATGAAATGKAVTAAITAKQIIAGAAAVVVIGGTTTGVIIANNNNKEAEEVTVEENKTEEELAIQEEAVAEQIDSLMQACGVAIGDGVVYYPSDYVDDGEYALYKMDLDTQTKETLLTGMDYHEAAVYGNNLYTVESEIAYGDAGMDEEEDYEEPVDTPLKIIRYDLDTMEREQIGSGSDLLVVGDKMYARAYNFFGNSFGGEKIVSMDLNTDEVEILADTKKQSDLGFGDDYALWLKIFYYEGTIYTEYDYLENLKFMADFKIDPNRDEGYKAFALDGTPTTIEDKGVYYISPMPEFGEFSSVSSEFSDKLVWNYAHVNYGWTYVDTNDVNYLINEDGTRINL